MTYFKADEEEGEGEAGSVIKKGDSEYVVVVSGAKDTGLSGKYWSDLENLGSRRRCTITPPPKAPSPVPEPTPTKSKKPTTPKEAEKAPEAEAAPADANLTTPKKRGPKPKNAEEKASEAPKSPGAGRGRKRKVTEGKSNLLFSLENCLTAVNQSDKRTPYHGIHTIESKTNCSFAPL